MNRFSIVFSPSGRLDAQLTHNGGFSGDSHAWTFSGSITAAFQTPTGAPNGTPPTAAVPLVLGASGFNGLTIVINTPEPSTYALCGLVAGAAFWFRRRRS